MFSRPQRPFFAIACPDCNHELVVSRFGRLSHIHNNGDCKHRDRQDACTPFAVLVHSQQDLYEILANKADWQIVKTPKYAAPRA